MNQTASRVTISVRPVDDRRMMCKPATFCNDFPRYLAATRAAGAKYDAGRHAQVLPIDALPNLLHELASADFDADVSPELLATLETRLTEIETKQASAASRLSVAEARLAEEGKALFGYQKAGILWLSGQTQGCVLADDMGLGKTAQVLLSAGNRLVAVVPAAVRANWRQEVSKWRSDLTCEVMYGEKNFRWPEEGECIIIGYSTTGAVSLAGAPPAGVDMFLDEAQVVKNRKAAVTQRVQAMANAVRAAGGRVVAMSGTPVENRPPELWSILSVVGREMDVFGTYYRFRSMMGGRQGRYATEWGGSVSSEVPELLSRAMLRRRKMDVLSDLPEKRYALIPVEVSAEHEAIIGKCVARLEAATGLTGDQLADAICGAMDLSEEARPDGDARKVQVPFEMISALKAALSAAKTAGAVALAEQYENDEEPVVFVSNFLHSVNVLKAREGWESVDGSVSSEDRLEVVNRFQAGELKGITMTAQAGGVGLNLTRAANLVIIDRAWNPAVDMQAMDRIHRIGQTRGVLISILVTGHPLEMRIEELQQRKMELIKTTVEGVADRQLENLEDPTARLRSALALGRTGTPAPAQVDPTRVPREAQTPQEKWAEEGLKRLVAFDPDRASTRNAVGFNRLDNRFGHATYSRLLYQGGLTGRQWAALIRMLRKYSRQIGPCPDAAENSAAENTEEGAE